jgi:glucosamine-phosphate N-acetyltransferase
MEYKFIRGCGTAGHVEGRCIRKLELFLLIFVILFPFASDVVVDKSMRGRNLGIKLIEALKYLAQNLGCYKLILDCSQVKHFLILHQLMVSKYLYLFFRPTPVSTNDVV